jgi:putative transposase
LAVLTEIKNRVWKTCAWWCAMGSRACQSRSRPRGRSRRCRPASSHLIRNTFRYAGRQDWDELARDLRPVYTAVNAEMAAVRFEEFADKWATRYPAIIKLWRSAWEEFIPFLDYDVEIRKIICSTNAVESITAATGEPCEPGDTSRPTRPP